MHQSSSYDEDFLANAQKAQTPAADPSIHAISLQQEIDARVRKILANPNPSERTANLQPLLAQAETCKRNISNGYTQWQGELDKLQTIIARVERGY